MTGRERELRREVLASLVDGREATREALLVLADWWEQWAGDSRCHAVRAILEHDEEWNIDAMNIERVTLSGDWKTTGADRLRSWRCPAIRVWIPALADPSASMSAPTASAGGTLVTVEVLLAGKPFDEPEFHTGGTVQPDPRAVLDALRRSGRGWRYER